MSYADTYTNFDDLLCHECAPESDQRAAKSDPQTVHDLSTPRDADGVGAPPLPVYNAKVYA